MLTETLLKIPFSVIGRCSHSPTTHWLQGKCTRINLSQAAYGMILQNHFLFLFLVSKSPLIFEAGHWKDFQK
jgi:hypothetical protein